MKRVAVFVLLVAGAMGPVLGQSESAWMFRGRLANIEPDSSGSVAPGLNVDVDNRWGLTGDIVYFWTPNVSTTLLLTYPQKHDVSVATIGEVGDLRQLPPTLTLDYHFDLSRQARIYLGVGVTWFYITDDDLALPDGTAISADESSFGPAVRLGLDYQLSDQWYLNLDVQKTWVSTEVSVPALALSGDVDIDPWVYGIGFAYRF
ncbi:MAG: outer membrane beta-barrel protein [Wenzhouxiangellaceae bacterium]